MWKNYVENAVPIVNSKYQDNKARQFYSSKNSAATQWVNQTICQCILLAHLVAMYPDAPYIIILLFTGRVLPSNGLMMPYLAYL